jgi:hypothetical protein
LRPSPTHPLESCEPTSQNRDVGHPLW